MRFYAFYDSFCILSLAMKTNKNKDKWLVFCWLKEKKTHLVIKFIIRIFVLLLCVETKHNKDIF